MGVPAWLRRAVPDPQGLGGQGVEDVGIAAGAAIGALDTVVRRQERWAGVWRQRLALAAAAISAQQAGRTEDESRLRDAVLLTRPGDDVGPAGRMLLAWRRLASGPAGTLMSEAGLAVVLEDLGHAYDDRTLRDMTRELRRLGTGAGMVEMLTGAFGVAECSGFGVVFGSWLADVLLAQRLGWTHAVPLLGTDMPSGLRARRLHQRTTPRAAGHVETDLDRATRLLAAQARAALRAIDLSAELGRRADRLLAVAPKLRAKAADIVVDRLLSGDAMVASEEIAGISERGLRRLFERLVELGAVRELSGRPNFRIYGL